MFTGSYLPVNAPTANSPVADVERPYIDPIPDCIPVPGEDGERQSVSNLVFDCCLAAVALAALIVFWPVLQAVHV